MLTGFFRITKKEIKQENISTDKFKLLTKIIFFRDLNLSKFSELPPYLPLPSKNQEN